MFLGILLLLFLPQSGGSLLVTAPVTHQVRLGTDVTIPCSFTVNAPPINQRQVVIFWYFQGKEILKVQNGIVTSSAPHASYTGQVEEGKADLSIANVSITDGGIYKCSILYSPERREKEIRLDIQAPPQINITDNVVLTNKKSVLRSSVSGFYPVDIDIKWFRYGDILDNVIVEKPQRLPDGTYSVTSSVTVTATEEDRGRTFSCRVQHESLTQPLQEDFTLVYGALPSVHIQSQAFRRDVMQTLVCSATEFYPESIALKWFLNGTLVENTKTQRSGSSAVKSVYEFLPTNENWGLEITCEVEHGTLNTPHVERLLVIDKDLKPVYRIYVRIASALLLALVSVIVFDLLWKHRKKRLPRVRHITCSRDGFFSLDVDHFYPEDIIVSWAVIQPPSSSQPRPIKESTIVKHKNQDGTFNATSTSESLRGLIRKNEPYIVRAVVEHKKLKHPVQREWDSDDKENTDFFVRPEVEMMQIKELYVNKETQLRCTMSHFYPDELTVNWFKKVIGKEELSPITNSGRFRIVDIRSEHQTDKTFTHNAMLEITPSLEDQGSEVICRVEHHSLEEPIERTTGPLQVMVRPTAQQPIQLSINDPGDIVASFTLSSFYPENIKISWFCGSNHAETPAEGKPSKSPDGTFNITSQCTIPGCLFKYPSHSIKVTWDHPSMESQDSREISVRDDFPWHPAITKIPPLILQVGTKATVEYEISGYFPKDLKVTWIEKKGARVNKCSHYTRYTMLPMQHERMADNSFTCSPCLSFTPTSDMEELEIICRVEHPSLEQPIEKSTGPPRVNVAPQVQKDVTFTPYGPDKVQCSLSFMKFYPQNLNIIWAWEQTGKSLKSTKKLIQTDDEKTFDATSECVVPWEYFKSLVRVTWTHDSLPQPGSRDLHITDFPWCPQIEEIEKMTLLANTKAKIQYRLSHYFPCDLTVVWLKKQIDGNLVGIDYYSQNITTAQIQPDNTYSCTASLLITPTLADQGSEFICRVKHPSLEKPIERSTGPLQVYACPRIHEPIQKSLTDRGYPCLALHLLEFHPKPITITWRCSCRQSLSSRDEFESSAKIKFDVTSTCIIPPQHKSHSTITVTWKHDSMEEPETREICIKDPVAPIVTDPIRLNLCESGEVLCSVRLENFFPTAINLTWTFGGIPYTGLKQKEFLLMDSKIDSKKEIFGVITECRIPWNRLQFPVRVSWRHESMEESQSTELQRSDYPWQPVLGDIEHSDLVVNTECNLQCKISGYFPNDVTVTWHKKTKGTDDFVPVTGYTYKTPQITHQRQPDNTYSCTASLLITPTQADQVSEFICRVQHPSLEKPIERRAGPLYIDYGPSLSDHPAGQQTPNKETQREVPASNNNTSSLTQHRQSDNLYTSTASARITPTQSRGYQQLSQENPTEGRKGPQRAIEVLRPQIDELDTSNLTLNQESAIQCKISGYSPDNLTVSWCKRSQYGRVTNVTESFQYKMPALTHQIQQDSTYSCTASLVFTPTQEDQGAEFTCKVQHPSLEKPELKKTRPLQINRKSNTASRRNY
ncbi:uncharacterized protein [Hyperolius riggenbachi]|uniref:uncharacterized protein n=1 Tax=Hyperolius riggenbachi TaxID=752182 RepID=UPI0035A273F4